MTSFSISVPRVPSEDDTARAAAEGSILQRWLRPPVSATDRTNHISEKRMAHHGFNVQSVSRVITSSRHFTVSLTQVSLDVTHHEQKHDQSWPGWPCIRLRQFILAADSDRCVRYTSSISKMVSSTSQCSWTILSFIWSLLATLDNT